MAAKDTRSPWVTTTSWSRTFRSPRCQDRCRLLRSLEDPDRADTHYVLAELLRGEGRGGEAVAALKQALALSPERVDIHFDLAVTYAQQVDFKSAWSEIHRFEQLGGAPPPEFLAALRAQMLDPGILTPEEK